MFEANHANSGASTLNVDSVGAKAIVKHDDVALASGDIKAGQICFVAYEAAGDNFQMLSPPSGPVGVAQRRYWRIEFNGRTHINRNRQHDHKRCVFFLIHRNLTWDKRRHDRSANNLGASGGYGARRVNGSRCIQRGGNWHKPLCRENDGLRRW
jgi:hypothetical protein